jgi:hypothetical protein
MDVHMSDSIPKGAFSSYDRAASANSSRKAKGLEWDKVRIHTGLVSALGRP